MTRQQFYALSVLILAGFVTIFDLFVVNVGIVRIEKDLSANLTEITLIIVLYELGFGLLLITGGRLGDIYGRRQLYQVGMLCFTVSSFACALAPNTLTLIIARLIQGLSAALLFPQVYASIRLNFNAQQAKFAFSCLGMSLGLAAIAGQVFGGWIIQLDLWGLSWRNIFLVNIPIGIIALYGSKHLLSHPLEQKLGLDLIGVIISALALIFILIPILMLPAIGWSMLSYGSITIGAGMLWIFYVYEKKLLQQARTPLLDVNLLKNKSFICGGLIVLAVYSTSSAFPMAMTILFQSGFALNPLQSGLLFMPASIGFILASWLTPRWQQSFGQKVLLIGALLYLLSYVALIFCNQQFNLQQHIILLLPLMLNLGFSQGMIMTPLLNWTLSFICPQYVGMASGVLATLQQIGAAFGAAMVGSLLYRHLQTLPQTSQTQPNLEHIREAFNHALSFNIGIMLVACIVLLYLIWHQFNLAAASD
ncbi:MFS transporter [Acinetobacter larvae]|uniref:Major facilitator superfamily (MFS) profile domain-containing protein n=1 Tax=Acinetobacter larvae TaxID=1789224 RepID=A0A1B2LX23_9GAMM|nr:MFS transporter [Acinetobacter larvae]AOA57323.1 hypothetical protein BFG52_02430 [Acinetobacter larvae]